jgi:hypothetical protein
MADEPTNTDTDANATPDSGGAEQSKDSAPAVEPEQTDKTFTQAELDRVVSDRLRRERDKYSDYDDLKNKASKLDEIEQQNQSEIEKANGKATALAEENRSLSDTNKLLEAEKLRLQVALDRNVPSDLVDRLRGETKEELEADADALLKRLSPKDATDFDGGPRKPEKPAVDVHPGLGRLAHAYAENDKK